ncbi:MAG: hypothetical protein AAF554_08725 [Bacteroidota bacterium]
MHETVPNLRGYLNRIHLEELLVLEKIHLRKQKIFKTLKYLVYATAVFTLLVISFESDYVLLDIQEINFLDVFMQYLFFAFVPITIVLICALLLTSYQFNRKLNGFCVMDKTPFALLKKEIDAYFKEENKSYNFIKAKE